MTTPYERSKSVIETREFLQMLASAGDIANRSHTAKVPDEGQPLESKMLIFTES
ncbi:MULTISPECIES: BPSL0761 family protein [Burkholderia]|uniref:BPSL0761 family protein n=1 Tax=Burkholderia TaxID=32008 RepID=UPI0012BA78D4|nr:MULTISPECIES: BPSL0761 family protein [Burkholderia]CAG9216341.1 hypothetical protein BVI1335_2790002 [Burkholderia vietnamiensis]